MNMDKRRTVLPAPATSARRETDEEDRFHKVSNSISSSTKTNTYTYSTSTIISIVAFYWIASLSLVFLNKYILSTSEYKFPYPLFVTWFQFFVALSLLFTWGYLGKRYPSIHLIPPYEFDLGLAKKIAPLSFMYVMMLVTNNLCLQYVEVTFYQVARSLSIVFNIIFTYTILGQMTSWTAMLTCAIVFLGFILGSYGEINFSWEGLLFGVASSAFVALYGIYVKKTLPLVENDQWRLLHYNTTISIFMLIPLVLFSGEITGIIQDVWFFDEIGFWLLMIITGITGLVINVAMFLQIKVTSALTNTISGSAKACVQTGLAAWWFQNPISGLNALGILLSLAGSASYSFVRYKERK